MKNEKSNTISADIFCEAFLQRDAKIHQKEQEIYRLNNIIDELEKESHLGMLENQNNNDYAKGLYCAYAYINNKIKELKGGK